MVAAKRIKADKNKRVKAVARKRVGTPKPARVLEERTGRDRPKYKKRWQDEAEA
ncbi:MAG TPA: hypothetical protein VH477_19100 [Bryobacteraceae bacterium]